MVRDRRLRIGHDLWPHHPASCFWLRPCVSLKDPRIADRSRPLPKLSRRTLVIGAIVLLVVVLIGLSLQPQPVSVDVARIDRGDLLVTIDDEGQTRLKDVYVVSAPVAGQVRRIDIEAGDTVTAGDTILALFEPSDTIMLNLRSRTEAEAFVKSAEAAVGLAEAEQARAQAQLDYDRAELKRAQPLA